MNRFVKLAGPVLAALMLTALAIVAARGLIDPAAGSERFGMTVSDAAGQLFYRVYLSRNLVIVAAGFAFLATGMWRALAILTTAALVLPVFDHLILSRAGGPVPPLHLVTLLVLAIVAGLLWLRVRAEA